MRQITLAAPFVLAALACGETTTAPDPTPDPATRVASVAVESPSGALRDVGSSTQLTGTATDGSGQAVTATLAWSSSDPAVAPVTATGLVTAAAPGSATISATTEGVTGSLTLTVVDADVDGVTALLTDPWADALLSAVDEGAGGPLPPQWSTCVDLASGENLEALVDCVTDVRALLAAEPTPETAPLRAVLGLLLDAVVRLLALP